MKREYEAPEFICVEFDLKDSIAASGDGDGLSLFEEFWWF